MPISFKAAAKVPSSGAVLRGVATDRLDSSGVPKATLEALSFEGKAGQVVTIPSGSSVAVLVGIGPTGEIDVDRVRSAAANGARALKAHARVATTLVEDCAGSLDRVAASQAVVEGLRLGGYSFDRLKPSAKPSKLSRVTVVGAARVGLDRGAVIADAVCLARDLVNEPGGSLTPPVFAERAATEGRAVGIKVKVMDLAAIRRARMGGLLGVNRGSTIEPRFVEMSYDPPRATAKTPTLAFVGKGITFDSGGLDLKTAAGMLTMKCDMSGAAAVVAALIAIGRLGVPVRVRGYVPMTDNMTGGDATRPGDVLTIRNGKTVEIGNTDAEGRLILADALSLATEHKPSAIVDLATLTGACMVALGDRMAGLMSNNDGFAEQVASAATRAGETTWRLPLPVAYRKQIDSPIADLKNVGGSYAGALTAGLFLQEFVGEGIPWVHLDIAGPAFVEFDEAEITKGGVGYGVRTLIELASTFSTP